ncbi:hypothetical protein BDW02DRAFT_616202 [Decorospora gaudefroyi]|uniref:Helicase ATP-binding domain-containing protein n=1 Tax=Decorospora gaudefroyi TaxID=184978 RepID=A0A6A5KPP6_9PLEO|nr:hypothetical protein BDW02DRAFT_616202 [Decorospora gaudefroyi]
MGDADGMPSPVTTGELFLEDAEQVTQCNKETTLEEDAEVPKISNCIANSTNGRSRRSRARVSYVEPPLDDALDRQLEREDDAVDEDGSDVYISPTSGEESEVDIESISSEDEALSESDTASMDTMPLEDDISIEDSAPDSSRKRAGKGIDLSLPPLDNIGDCISDMTANAVEHGFAEALSSLKGRAIRVATMCSGTESPLLVLSEISRALQRMGLPPIDFQHEFSAEIEVVKQAYIERNFQPKILFRDVRDFIHQSASKATTAYGAEVDMPTDIDMLVAGFVCKDLSRMNTKSKELTDGGESGDTWLAVYTYAQRFRPSIVLLENVKAQKLIWNDVVLRWDNIGYEAAWVYCDTKNYYLPQTRERMYMIAIERKHFGKNVGPAASQWRDLMQKLERQCSSPYEAFLPESLKDSSGYSTLKSEPDWALCKLRYDHIRSQKRLGIMSPISRRNDSGMVTPPDFADRTFYNSQSSRVHDAIDIAHLEGAQKGFDSLYKMALWDVSQNVDRFKTHLGIAPCLTPNGQDFASNRQHALSGSQLLLLQGMPLDRLLFANETQRDLQDLAGNAMSTTVIGASIISAIISGSKAFRPRSLPTIQPSVAKELKAPPENMLTRSDLLEQTVLEPCTYEHLDLAELRREAKLCARMCNCERNKAIGKAAFLICSACGHSACTSCAGNPRHVYAENMSSRHRTQTPEEFQRCWRPRLPVRLKFDSFPDVRSLASNMQAKDHILNGYLSTLSDAELGLQYFCIGDFDRQQLYWKVTYNSPRATLELKLGHDIQWSLFIKCPPDVAGDSPLRDFLKVPIAIGVVTDTLLNVESKIHIPYAKHQQLHVSGSPNKTSSWRRRLGLPDYKDETVPMTIKIRSNDRELTAITGDYGHLPHCGTASNSLYKRTTGETNMFMFLDPHPIGHADRDSFVFSQDISRKHYGDSRICLARVDPSWRPWHIKDEQEHIINVATAGIWESATMQLRAADVSLEVGVLQEDYLDGHLFHDCSQAVTFLDVIVPGSLATRAFTDYSWALERPRTLPAFWSWQTTASNEVERCSCAPRYPRLLWSVNDKGVATAHEDRKAAAVFERALKTRPPVFQLKATGSSTTTRIQVGINVVSLLHRAKGRLIGLEPIRTAWRLMTDHADLAPQPFAKFRLQSNSQKQKAPSGELSAPKYLRGAQLRSMLWMAAQELGKETTVTETEEEVHPGLGWRVEAQAQATLSIRGGVLADHPSFGKTVTSIALLQSEFEKYTPEMIINQNRTRELPAFLDSAATIIVCPPHIARQWTTELKRFLGDEQYELYDVRTIEDFEQLEDLTIKALLNSRVIIVSWNLFADEGYVSELANFTGMPEPAMTSRRAFDAWMTRTLDEVPEQLGLLQEKNTMDYADFQLRTQQRLEERLQHTDFKAVLPLKLQHGSAYQSFNAMQSALKVSDMSTTKTKAKSKGKPKTKSTRDGPVPLFHLFRFNRVVVDEYHYLNDTKVTANSLAAVGIKKIAAHKRWVLSGTPALANFSDVDQIASFLGIKLGRDCFRDEKERVRRADQTDVENFLSQTQVMSRQWHLDRHERAQQFLDIFVRQNEAELQHIPCSEELLPVELSAAHHAVYLELSQYLISQRMQIKKLNKKSTSDRTNRLNDSLDNSASAEEALLKSALLFETDDGVSGIELLIGRRSEQLESTKDQLMGLLTGFEGLMIIERKKARKEKKNKTSDPGIVDMYGQFTKDITQYNWLGDEEASQGIRRLIQRAAKSPKSTFAKSKSTTEEKQFGLLKERLSQLRDVALEFAHRSRSQRFVASIRDHLQSPTPNKDHTRTCSSPECDGATSLDELHLIAHCGHTACKRCLESRHDDETCVQPGCNAHAIDGNLIQMSDLGSDECEGTGRSFGNKLESIAELVDRLPADDQGIVFAPNEETISILEYVFNHYEISYLSLNRNTSRRAASAKVMEDFKTNQDPKTKKKLLLLNLGSESAAGVNLTNANHIIFVSPLLSKTQHDYDSAMAQAIARSRRYGQEKKVHIHHVLALRTIDVDILEHHHKRNDAISTSTSRTSMPKISPTTKKQRTKLVRNNKGEMLLVPVSWLAGVGGAEAYRHASFTSLIHFSDAFDVEGEEG